MKMCKLSSRLLPIFLSVALLLGTGFSASAYTANTVHQLDTTPGVDVLSRGEGEITSEISIPWESLELVEVEVEGRTYTRVSLAGRGQTVEAGLPALPVIVEQLGVPFGAEVTVEVVPGEAHTLALSAPVLPG